MDGKTFALIAMFGVPFGAIGLLVLVHKIVPGRIWKSFTVQAIVTGWFLAAIATPFLVAHADAQGEYFEDESELVSAAFALPGSTIVDHQRDRTLRLGDCWRHAVNWRSQVQFASPQDFDRWLAQDGYRKGVVDQIAGYFGVEPDRISIAEGALDMRARDAKYQLRDDHDSYSWNTRILEYYEPFVCTAIDRDAAGGIALRPCDPVAPDARPGNAGWVIINPDARERTLEGRIYYAQGPHYCTNPVRRAVNDALGLPHPEGGEPNTQIAGVLPL